MLQKFLFFTLLNNSVYLGYNKKFAHSDMFIHILGSRYEIDLHNLNQTVFAFKKLLHFFSLIWRRFGLVWALANKLYDKNITFLNKVRISSLLHIQTKPWISGFFTNALSFQIVGKLNSRFPACLFYTNYSKNITHFEEAKLVGLLQTGIADTNTKKTNYDYFVNANEKSDRSCKYFLDMIVLSALRSVYTRKRDFLLG